MSDGIDETIRALDALEARLTRAVESGLDQAAPGLAEAAQATDHYHDQTGATRAGTVAYRAGNATALGEALAQVQAKNPGQGLLQTSEPIPDTARVLILTVPTRYITFLEADTDTRFLADTVLTEAVRLAAVVRGRLAQELAR